ncbi:NUDIX domain-containing protein [Leptospira idonii]|uniref:NUDIX domain-containing protein n=1 Tax=Leptospira idonii TaxID=1193500 RepID=A0A4R9LTS5_9LEPT|nr:NUDIX domain-containing protein [Leptospira idonii]TGN17102.1 NUDIX domain-containing protein [Leptospira idonii]
MSDHGFFQITQKLFLRDGNKLLVMRDKKSGHGDLPGGRMNDDEFFDDWMKSVYREIEEELGKNVRIQVEPKPIFIHKHRVNEGNHPCIIVAYHAKLVSGEIQISDEHDYMNWVSVSDYDPSELFSEYMLEAVNVYLKEYA